MELYHDYLKVNLEDIWPYESYLFQRNGREDSLMRQTVDSCQFRIINHCDPTVQISKTERKKYSDYEERIVLNWKDAAGNLGKEVELDYFIRGFEVYNYNYSIEFDKNDTEYLHFFALKLSQYNKAIGKVKAFLDYQRCLNDFKSNNSFYEFFSIALLEHDCLISSKLEKAIQIWKASEAVLVEVEPITLPTKTQKYSDPPSEYKPLIENSPSLIPLIEKKPITKGLEDNLNVPKNPEERKRLKEFKSFCFNVENTDTFVSEKKVSDALFTVYIALIEHEFLSKKENDFESFTMIFRNLPIPFDSRVMWLGNRKELQTFIKVLRKDLKVLAHDYNLHYYIALKCFKNRDGVSFLHEHIAEARDKKSSLEELKKILKPLKVLVDSSPQKLNSPQVQKS